ncbi:uncharacterized protein [Dermacentor andersoni]|uniref:uncharacterized protein isoform X2 n=1 Tax=Dermacentor andersoni TaxID=34620 RepID=UPI003B3A5D1B
MYGMGLALQNLGTAPSFMCRLAGGPLISPSSWRTCHVLCDVPVQRLAIASLEAGSLRERNTAVRRRIEQRRMARHRRRQQASSTEGNSCEEEPGDQQKWQEVRPFLAVNDHLCGPVSHGSCGPKTEVETLVEAAIANGDFDKAEMLSDHLGNRQFAVKIADAFAAKRCAEEQEAKRRRDYVKRQTKLPWGLMCSLDTRGTHSQLYNGSYWLHTDFTGVR